ncbi:MAG: bifunctional nuclease family protein [Nitrospira sp.]|nr:bifunctional nuclease family protein [Candidatus Manganitrophaceae bacterium]HIL35740.1 bifunctional nuclease family protein [Candidatus Manganitrophaceae bacterium]
MNIPLKVHSVITDPNTEAQIVILKDPQNMELLPIWVGLTEGNAIRLAMEGVAPPRPLTHDLLSDLLKSLHVTMDKVLIHDVNDGTYFATLYLIPKKIKDMKDSGQFTPNENNEELTVDARPSDAIALALRMGVPIYVTEEVLHKKGAENLDAWLEKLKPKDFGPYDA